MLLTLTAFRRLALAAAILLAAASAHAGGPMLTPVPTMVLSNTPPALPGGMALYGASEYSDSYTATKPKLVGQLYKLDPQTAAVISSTPLWCAGTFYGNNHGLARNPITGVVYGVFTLGSEYDRMSRYLCTVNLTTGELTKVGGKTQVAGISAIAFDAGGYLYGYSNNVGSFCEFDLVSGQAAQLFSVSGGGGQGLGLAFNSDDQLFYKLGENSLTRFDAGGVLAPQSQDLLIQKKAKGLAYEGQGWFLQVREGDSSRGAQLLHLRADGLNVSVGLLPDYLKGIVIAPNTTFAAASPTISPTPFPALNGQFLYSSDRNINQLRKRSLVDGSIVASITLSAPDQNVGGGIIAMTTQPGTGKVFAAMGDSPNTCVRCLATVDLRTGVVSPINPIGTNVRVHSLAFTSNGKLWATAGQQSVNGARGYLFRVDPATAAGDPVFKFTDLEASIGNDDITLAVDPSGSRLIVSCRTDDGPAMFLLDPLTFASSRVDLVSGFADGGAHSIVQVSGSQYLSVSRYNGIVQPLDMSLKTARGALFKIDSDDAIVLAGNIIPASPTDTPTPAGAPSDTFTATSTRTSTPSKTPTDTPTDTVTQTPTITETPTSTGVITDSSTPTATRSLTATRTWTPTITYTPHAAFNKFVYVVDGNAVINKFDADGLFNGAQLTPVATRAITMPSYANKLRGLAKHPTNGKYYTVVVFGTSGKQDRALATLDLDSGEVSVIGSTGTSLISLAFSPDGTLWGIGGNSIGGAQLYSVNISTGQATPRADYSQQPDFAYNYTRALAYNPLTGKMLLMDGQNPAQLHSIDLTTFAISPVGNAMGWPDSASSLYYLGANQLLAGMRNGWIFELTADGVPELPLFSGGGMTGYVTGITDGPDYAFTVTITPSSTPTPYPTPNGVLLYGDGTAFVQADPNSLAVLDSVSLQLDNVSGVSNLTGFAKHPTTGTFYGIATVHGSTSDRRLISFDPATGAGHALAKLDNLYSAMSFDGVGNLYLCSSTNGNDPRNMLFRFDWDRMKAVPVMPLPGIYPNLPSSLESYTSRSYEGMALAYDPDDNKIYFLAEDNQNSVPVFGRYDPANDMGYQSLVFKGTFGDPVKGLAYVGHGVFYVQIKQSDVYSLSTQGDFVDLGSPSSDMKGLSYGPAISMASATPTNTPTDMPTPSLALYVGSENGHLDQLNPNDGSSYGGVNVTYGGNTVQNVLALTKHPLTGVYYAVVNLSDDKDRILASVDPSTGEATLIRKTGHLLYALAFDAAGQLYGASGPGDVPSNSLYSIDANTGQCSFKARLADAANGGRYTSGALAFDSNDGRLWWMGRDDNSGQDAIGSFDLTSFHYRRSELSDSFNQGTRGLVYAGGGVFFAVGEYGPVRAFNDQDQPVGYSSTYSRGDRGFGGVFDAPRSIVTHTPSETPTPYPTPSDSLYAFVGNNNVYFELDAAFNTVSSNNPVVDPAHLTVRNFFGAAKRASDGKLFVVVGDDNNRQQRYLATMHLASGQLTTVAVTNPNLINIAFAADGTLYGVTGNDPVGGGARSVVQINVSTGVATPLKALPSQLGSGGALAFNPDDGKLYLASWDSASKASFGRYTLPGLAYESLTLSASTNNYPRSLTYYGYGVFALGDHDNNLYTVNTSGGLNFQRSVDRFWGLFYAPHVAFGTVTLTPTISPTFTVTETANGTFTETPTHSESPTYTESATPSATPSVTLTPTLTQTFNLSDTVTSTQTVSPTLTVTKTATKLATLTVTRTIPPTRTVTVTWTPSETPVPNVPAYLKADGVLGDNLGISMGAAKKGEDLCLGFASAPDKTAIELYNFSGERVVISDLSGSRQCIQTGSLAPGVYFLRMKIALADGRSQERWQRIAILP